MDTDAPSFSRRRSANAGESFPRGPLLLIGHPLVSARNAAGRTDLAMLEASRDLLEQALVLAAEHGARPLIVGRLSAGGYESKTVLALVESLRGCKAWIYPFTQMGQAQCVSASPVLEILEASGVATVRPGEELAGELSRWSAEGGAGDEERVEFSLEGGADIHLVAAQSPPAPESSDETAVVLAPGSILMDATPTVWLLRPGDLPEPLALARPEHLARVEKNSDADSDTVSEGSGDQVSAFAQHLAAQALRRGRAGEGPVGDPVGDALERVIQERSLSADLSSVLRQLKESAAL